MNVIKKNVKKDIYLQRKERKLLIIFRLIQQYNNGISWKIQVKINNESQGPYNEDNQISFKTLMLRSSCKGILVKGSITVPITSAADAAANNANKNGNI